MSSALETPASRGQPLRAFRAGDDAEIHFGLADLRARDCDTIVASHGQLEPAAKRRTMDRHHDGLRAVLDALEQVVPVRRGGFVAPCRLLERADVGAGNEHPAGAANHDSGDARIARGLVECCTKRFRHARA